MEGRRGRKVKLLNTLRPNNTCVMLWLLLAMVSTTCGCLNGGIRNAVRLSEVRFDIDDRRGCPKGKICAVAYRSLFNRVYIQNDVYVGSAGEDILLQVYGGRNGGFLGHCQYVDNAAEKFAMLRNRCLKDADSSNEVHGVAVTFYWENAFPETHVMNKDVFAKSVDSWNARCRDNDDHEGRSKDKPTRSLRGVDFREFKALIDVRQYIMIMAFPNDNCPIVDACVPSGLNYSCSELFRPVYFWFPIDDEGIDCFLKYLQEHLTSFGEQSKVVRVVVW